MLKYLAKRPFSDMSFLDVLFCLSVIISTCQFLSNLIGAIKIPFANTYVLRHTFLDSFSTESILIWFYWKTFLQLDLLSMSTGYLLILDRMPDLSDKCYN